jgi:hypothetical protein
MSGAALRREAAVVGEIFRHELFVDLRMQNCR